MRNSISKATTERRFNIRSVLFDHDTSFRSRGHEILRIEALSDAVFAFTISLLVMSLEVPQTFSELRNILQGFVPFVATTSIVFLFWQQQNRFFRYYGINDSTITVLNMALLMLVLFYVYPLKFLFSLLFGMASGINFFPKAALLGLPVLTEQELPDLVIFYSAGYASIWTVFYLLYQKAWTNRHRINLNKYELEETLRQLRGALVNIGVGVMAAVFSILQLPAVGGLCFVLIFPLLLLNNQIKQRRLRKGT